MENANLFLESGPENSNASHLALVGRAPEPGAVRPLVPLALAVHLRPTNPSAYQPNAWLVAVMGPLTDMSITLNLPAGVASMKLFRLSRCWSLPPPTGGQVSPRLWCDAFEWKTPIFSERVVPKTPNAS